MRSLIFLAILLPLSITYSISQAQDYDFRKTQWGMTRSQVIATEDSKPVINDEDEVSFLVEVSGLKAQAGYAFINKKLVRAGYQFREKYSGENQYISDYKKIKDILIQKYGEPKLDKEVWNNKLYRNDPTRYGFAVTAGHLTYGSIWTTPNSVIHFILYGNNFKAQMGLVYTSIKYEGLLEEKTRKKNESEF